MNNQTVLVVDDNEVIRRVMTTQLLDAGFMVETAESVSEAEHVVSDANLRIDIILCDVNMPLRNGTELLESIGDRKNEILFYFFSAEDSISELRALDLGAAGFFRKPLHVDEFMSRIKYDIEQRKTRMAPLTKLAG